jgi:alpha-D-ribose 1-methylphosphonate 5-triphosphate synthase subunit PhnG
MNIQIMTDAMDEPDSEQTSRKATMAVVARATAGELAAIEAIAPAGLRLLRAPEIGLVMVRGRIGGDGAPFNLGEATVTRAAVALETGELGFGHVLGRDKDKARLAALTDALWQAPNYRAAVDQALRPVRDRIAAECELQRQHAAATRVDFFTMVRGED